MRGMSGAMWGIWGTRREIPESDSGLIDEEGDINAGNSPSEMASTGHSCGAAIIVGAAIGAESGAAIRSVGCWAAVGADSLVADSKAVSWAWRVATRKPKRLG